jgi:hypothetical protein
MWVVVPRPRVARTMISAQMRGVIVLEGGRILGGTHESVWVGDWEVNGSFLHAKVRVVIYDPGASSPLMPEAREYVLEGELPVENEKRISGSMNVSGRPDLIMDLEMFRVAELPPS